MDVREKLFTLFQDCNNPSWKWFPNNAEMLKLIDYLIAHGVTVQEWISVDDRLPEMRDDGFVDAFLVTNGSLDHIAYFVDGAWIFTDNGQMKEPMFYDVTHWQYLPQPPKGE